MHPNLYLIENALTALYAGDRDRVAELVAEDVTFEVPGTHRVAGLHTGRDALVAAYSMMREATGDSYRLLERSAQFVTDKRVMVLVVETVARDGAELRLERALAFEVGNRQVRSMRVYEGSPQAAEQAFA